MAAEEPRSTAEDFDVLVCPTCRRDLPQGESECPECRGPAVPRYAVPNFVPPPPAHLLDDDTSETAAETREPVDDVDEAPEPPPVHGDPHFG